MTARKLGSGAAYLNALLAILTLLVALILIGPAVMADRTLFIEMVQRNPVPILLQDILKFITVAVAMILIRSLHHLLAPTHPRIIWLVSAFGLLSALCLLSNAVLSLIATSQAARLAPVAEASSVDSQLGTQLNSLLGMLAFLAIFTNAPWYLGVNWFALKNQSFPKLLAYLGLAMGGLSLVPPLGILVLLLSMPWSIGLGRVLQRANPAHIAQQ